MKRFTTVIGLVAMIALCLMPADQIFAQDTLDVAQGVGTLNIAVDNDTLAPPGRVYRLERGGYYLLEGNVRGQSGIPLRVVAADGDGPLPVLLPAVDETGASQRLFRPNDDGEFKNLYLTSIDELGNFTADTKNTLRLSKKDGTYLVQGCFLDYNQQSFVRMDAEGQSIYFIDCIIRNCGMLDNTGDSKMIDTRGDIQDSIVFVNSTIYTSTGRLLRSDNAPFNHLIMDHVTVLQMADRIQATKVLHAKITNSIFIDYSFEGTIFSPANPADTVYQEFIEIDSLNAPDLSSEEDRHVLVSNNSFALTPELIDFFDSIDSLQAPVVFNQDGMHMINTFPNMVYENSIEEIPEFADGLPTDSLLAYVQTRFESGYGQEGNNDIYQDRNGRASFAEDYKSFGPADNEFDFSYPVSAVSYTYAQGGFPLGDLNYFPDKKAEWEDWVATGLDRKESIAPDQFALDQNYPNPFNPSTSIRYQLNQTGKVNLVVYNVLGQEVRTLVNDVKQDAGQHRVVWDGRDNSGLRLPSGMYIYKLQSNGQSQSRKMLLIK